MLPDRVSNPGPPTYESGALQIALRGPARCVLASYQACLQHSLTNGNWVHLHCHWYFCVVVTSLKLTLLATLIKSSRSCMI